MTTFRVTVAFDFEVGEDTDPDEFHDSLRDALESDEVSTALSAEYDFQLETVRDIEVRELED